MTSKDRFNKAQQAFEELKQQPSIGHQLTETSRFDDAHYFLKNYIDRYMPFFIAQNPDRKWYPEEDIKDILKRKELKGDVTEYEFVKNKVDSVLALIEELLKEAEQSFSEL